MSRTIRNVTLYGTLTGPIWWPAIEAQLPIEVNLMAEAARDVSRSSMVEAIRSAVDGAGDFQSARLTADSFIMVERRRAGAPNGTVRSWARRVDVTSLPSLAEYVDAGAFTVWEDGS